MEHIKMIAGTMHSHNCNRWLEWETAKRSV